MGPNWKFSSIFNDSVIIIVECSLPFAFPLSEQFLPLHWCWLVWRLKKGKIWVSYWNRYKQHTATLNPASLVVPRGADSQPVPKEDSEMLLGGGRWAWQSSTQHKWHFTKWWPNATGVQKKYKHNNSKSQLQKKQLVHFDISILIFGRACRFHKGRN